MLFLSNLEDCVDPLILTQPPPMITPNSECLDLRMLIGHEVPFSQDIKPLETINNDLLTHIPLQQMPTNSMSPTGN